MKISVITINKNNYAGLFKTLESVKMQNYPLIEHIVIDSDSGSDIVNLCHSYNHLSDFISEPDNGIYQAFNKGVNKCTGDFIMFLNSGDTFISKSSVLKMTKKIDVKNMVFYWDIWTKKRIWHFPNDKILKHFVNSFIGHSGGCLFSQKIFKEIGNFDENFLLHGDREFFYRIFNHYGDNKFKKIKGYFCCFQEGGSIETNHLRKVISKQEKRKIEERWRALFSNNFMNWAYTQDFSFWQKIRIKFDLLFLNYFSK